MREFDFLGTHQDSRGVLEAIANCHIFSLIPDCWYQTTEPLVKHRVDDEVTTLLMEKPHVFLWSESFGSKPILIRQEEGLMAGRYRVRRSVTDPLIALRLPACYEADGSINLNFGSLSAPVAISDPITHEQRPAPEVKAAFELVRSVMKRQLVRHKLANWVWIGPDALELLKNGRARIAAGVQGRSR